MSTLYFDFARSISESTCGGVNHPPGACGDRTINDSSTPFTLNVKLNHLLMYDGGPHASTLLNSVVPFPPSPTQWRNIITGNLLAVWVAYDFGRYS